MDLPAETIEWLEKNQAEFHAGYHHRRDPKTGSNMNGVMYASIIDKRTGLVWAKAPGHDKLDAIQKAIEVAETKARPIRSDGISTDANELRDEVADLRARLKKYEADAEPKAPAPKGRKPKPAKSKDDDEQEPSGPEGLTVAQAAAMLAD